MKHGLIRIILAIMIFPTSIATSVEAMEIVKYELTPTIIKDIRLHEFSNGITAILIELTDAKRQEFALFTEKNIGNELHIVYSGQTLVRATVRAKIESGIINIGEWDSKQDAKTFMESLDWPSCK